MNFLSKDQAAPVTFLAKQAGGTGDHFVIEFGWNSEGDLDGVAVALKGAVAHQIAYQSTPVGKTEVIPGVNLGFDNQSGLGNAASDADETTKIDLSAVDAGVDRLAIFMVAYGSKKIPVGFDFTKVETPFVDVKVGKDKTGTTLFRFQDVSHAYPGDTVLYVGDFIKRNGAWEFVGRGDFIAAGNGTKALEGIWGTDYANQFKVA